MSETRDRLASLGLGYSSLETAAAVAGLAMLVESQLVARDGVVVVFDTGAGFKSEAPQRPIRKPIPNDESFWREKVLPGLRRAL